MPPRRHQQALVSNAADPRQVKWAQRREADRATVMAACVKAVMSTPEGRRLMAELLDMADVFKSVYEKAGSDMYFREGRRNFGLEIRSYLEVEDALFELMEREMRAVRRRLMDDATAVASTARPRQE